jgi:hypothetical protein
MTAMEADTLWNFELACNTCGLTGVNQGQRDTADGEEPPVMTHEEAIERFAQHHQFFRPRCTQPSFSVKDI